MNLKIEKSPATAHQDICCSIWRRLGAILYDSILLVCLIFLAWQPVPLLPDTLHPILGRGIRLGYLILVCFSFFAWFWCHGGQTLGMRTWKIKLVKLDSSTPNSISYKYAWLRFISAIISWSCLGLGFIWIIFHPQKLAWHDIYSGTRLVVVNRNR